MLKQQNSLDLLLTAQNFLWHLLVDEVRRITGSALLSHSLVAELNLIGSLMFHGE